ncbi:MAG: hypothetical protein WCD86_11255 [Ktedonobacteraceae bacterium]
MSISTRSKVSFILSVVVVVTLVAGFAVYGAGASRNTAKAASTGNGITATRGHLQVVGKVNLAALPKMKAGAQSQLAAMPLRLPPGINGAVQASKLSNAVKSHLPSAKSIPLIGLNNAHNFDGINSTQNLNASTVGLEPPDEGVAIGNNYVFNIVNLALAVYQKNGVMVAGPISADTFFGEPVAFTGGTLTSDPRVYFDAATNTWFATILFFDDGSISGNANSHFDLAVNPSGNPLGTWTIYRIDTTDANNNGCPCFGDYPEFGIDQFNVYVSTNEFSINGPTYNGAQIYALSKSQLEALDPTVNYVHFGNLSIGGSISYHVQPAIGYSNSPAEYFMDSLDPNGTFDNRLGVWAMTNRKSVTSGMGMPNLSSTIITSEAYGFPVLATTPPGYNGFTQEPTTGVVTPDFDAVYELEYINGHLDDTLDTAITIPGDTATRDGVAWFQVQPVLSGKVISHKTYILNQGYVADSGNYLLYPHINENAAGQMAMAFTLGGPNTFLSAAYAIMPSGSKHFNQAKIAAAGVEPDNGFTGTSEFGGVGRWGDYSNGEVDTSGNFWFATEYIPSNGDLVANWGNRIFEIQA